MKRILAALIALCLIVPAWAGWQSRDSNYNVAIGGAPLSPVTLTFQTAGVGGNTGNDYTFGTITFPNAITGSIANRRVTVVFASSRFSDIGPLVSAVFTPNSGPTVNADTFLVAGNDNANFTSLYLVSAVLPLGTTTTLDVTLSNTGGIGPRFAVFTLDNSTLSSPTSPTPSYNHFTTSPSTVTANLQSGGGLIAHYWGFGVSTEGWTAGVTSDGTTGGPSDFGHLSNTASTTGYAVTNTWTVSGSGNPDIALWVYR